MDTRQWTVTANNSVQNIGSAEFDRPNALGNLSLEYPQTVERMNAAIGAASTPFSAVHPNVAGRRNPVRAADDESITLGPAQEIGPRQHANGRTLLRAKKK